MTGFTIPIFLFEKGLALCNFIAFLSFHIQLRGTIMSKGITPAYKFIEKLENLNFGNQKKTIFTSILHFPSIFLISTSDTFILTISYIGLLCSLLALFGIFPMVNLFICMVSMKSFEINF